MDVQEYATGTVFAALNTCDGYHPEHTYNAQVRLRWFRSDPAAICFDIMTNVTGVETYSVTFCRTLFRNALRAGTSAGFPQLGEGNCRFRILPSNRTMVNIRFVGEPTFGERKLINVIMDRDAATHWLTGTFVHVPENEESKIYDIDSVIKQLLSK